LTPEKIEAVLSDFRDWLGHLPALPEAAPADAAEPIDLHTLLGQFIAVRHDVNLQTKAVRAQQEQNSQPSSCSRSPWRGCARLKQASVPSSSKPARKRSDRSSKLSWTPTIRSPWRPAK